jgi:Domain of unknown function (DUF6443)
MKYLLKNQWLIAQFVVIVANLPATVWAQALAPDASRSYILTQTPRNAVTNIDLSAGYQTTPTQVSYFDGLGRPAQTVQWRAAGDANTDVVNTTTVYDAFGRPNYTILPAPGGQTAGFIELPANNGRDFYADQYPFAETIYEPSPLNRVSQQFGAGQQWRNANRSTQISYGTATDVIRFKVNAFCNCIYGNVEGNSGQYDYLVNIATQTTTDEQNHTIISYTDLDGKLIRRDVQTGAATLTTAYVYDDLQRLIAVLPPALYNWFLAGGPGRVLNLYDGNGADNAVFHELAFFYRYEGDNDSQRGRITQQHTPGAGWIDLVFDNRDRPVMSQDAQDRAEVAGARWRFSQYDDLNREIRTGRLTLNSSASDLRADFASQTNSDFPATVNPAEADYLTENYYDTYDALTNLGLSFVGDGAFDTPWPSAQGRQTGGRVRNLETNVWYGYGMWYDGKGRTIQQQSQNHTGGTDRIDTQYRFNGEVLQTMLRHQKTQNGPVTTIKSQYDYDHVSRKTRLTYQFGDAQPFVMAQYSYDAIGRLVYKAIQPNGGTGMVSNAISQQSGSWTDASTWQSGAVPGSTDAVTIAPNHTVTLPNNSLVEAGWLTMAGRLVAPISSRLRLNPTANTGAITTFTPLQTVRYRYHLRGWLRGINTDGNNSPTLNDGNNALFAMQLGYDDANLFDGNIGRQTWLNSREPGQNRSYTYGYDGAKRLTGATYAGKEGEDYTVNNLGYDANGNIQTMNRAGADQLTYYYPAQSNKLNTVTDATGNAEGFTDGPNAGDDYEYWPDGSLKKDLNRGISLIEYNLLKLPRKITFSNGKVVQYQYDAMGKKLNMTVVGGDSRDYVGPFQYLNGNLFEVQTEEGRYTPGGGYEYFHKDHLGNVRVAYKQGANGLPTVTQYTDYDPWGLPLWGGLSGGGSSNRAGFNGKENLTELGSGLSDFNWRFADKSIGRFFVIDPLPICIKRPGE